MMLCQDHCQRMRQRFYKPPRPQSELVAFSFVALLYPFEIDFSFDGQWQIESTYHSKGCVTLQVVRIFCRRHRMVDINLIIIHLVRC